MALRKYTGLGALLALVAACGQSPDARPSFDGKYFRARVSAERDVRQNFFVTVQPVSASLDGAREAARYEAVKYCIKRYGSSDILWSAGPDETPTGYAIDGDAATFRGACASD
ncbi:hypothetical protein [Mesobacterium pallidum]|uniref:hypothetical protein n=1 Tax=Mesobacterium pallidum TaxID=2872037 RepID=UPI001EE30083|nr:hypothetical protein [Mesobacterium pallidum]